MTKAEEERLYDLGREVSEMRGEQRTFQKALLARMDDVDRRLTKNSESMQAIIDTCKSHRVGCGSRPMSAKQIAAWVGVITAIGTAIATALAAWPS